MVERNLVAQRLAAVRSRIGRIREKLPSERPVFLADRDLQELVAFNLFLAFQDGLDLAAHVIADRELDLPGTAREHFHILTRASILTLATAEAMAGCAGLRNLIAHAYGSLDLGRLWDELPAGLAALEAFSAEMATALS